MAMDYIEHKKYDLILREFQGIVESDLEPNTATTEEIEGALFEVLPKILKLLQDVYKEAHKNHN